MFHMHTTFFFLFLKTALQSLFLFHIKVSDISERVQTNAKAIIPLWKMQFGFRSQSGLKK